MAEGWFRYLQIVPIAPIGQCGRAADLKYLAAPAASSIRDLKSRSGTANRESASMIRKSGHRFSEEIMLKQ
jgi:hypothetical protein